MLPIVLTRDARVTFWVSAMTLSNCCRPSPACGIGRSRRAVPSRGVDRRPAASASAGSGCVWSGCQPPQL